MATATESERWWTAAKGKAADVTFQYVRRVEQELGDVFSGCSARVPVRPEQP
jgi:hypothetical protein